jgi:hypothetical protein|nr:MAG TPA: hypothetical protein [Caudoviricetes sp.]
MNFIDLPNIGNGTAEEQLAQIRSYIYRNNEQLNATLANLSVDKMWEQTASALSASNGDIVEVNKDLMSRYTTIRDLVIKTADVVIQSDEKFTSQMNGNYVAISDFGKYLRDTTLDISGSSVGIEYLYNYASQLETDLDNYKVNQTSYIKQGLLDESGASPIYGVEVGLLSDSFEYNGKVIDTRSNLKTRITPTEMSWWAENKKLFYLDKDSVYFPYAKITGGSINIGNGTFTVDSFGNINATSGTIGGLDITALTDMAMGIDIRPNATLVKKTATDGYDVQNIAVNLTARNINVASTRWYTSNDGEVWAEYTRTATAMNMRISTATAFENSSVLYVKAESKADTGNTIYTAVCSIGCVSDGENGTSVTILGSAYKNNDDFHVGTPYDLYFDSECKNIINKTTTTLNNGDTYLVKGYLFVWNNKNGAFVCTGEIKGKDGKDGIDAQAYEIYTDVSSVNKNILGTSCTPSTINIEFRQNSGGNTQLVTASEIRVWRMNGNKSVFYKSQKNTNNFSLSLSGEFNAYIATCTAIKIEVGYNNKVYSKTIPLIVSAEEIKAWAKVENGQTVIDGSKIYTGSITAEKIDIAYRNTLATGEQLTTAISNVNNSISAWASKIDSNTTDIANLTVKSDEISSTVTQKTSTSTIQSIIRQSANAVEFAWSKSNLGNVIKLENGDINFYHLGRKMSSVSLDGQAFYRDGLAVGYIGAGQWITSSTTKGLGIRLNEAYGKYITFGYQNGNAYDVQLAFATNNAIGNDNKGIFCYANLFGGNTFNSGWSTIRRFWLRDVSVEMGLRTKDNRNGQLYNTVTADIPYIRTIKSGSNGSITWTYSTLKVVNGLITSY